MNRTAILLDWARQLLVLVRAHDWHGLQRLDRRLADELPGLAEQGPWLADEAGALRKLNALHQSVRQLARDEQRALQDRINDLHAHREARQAYALQAPLGGDEM